jgi:pimeloyl-ACP methyl ester carboxylesterase
MREQLNNRTAELSPMDLVAALERAGTRRTTPMGTDVVAWRIWGRGTPLVLLHGGTGSWTHWIRNVEDLARDFTLVVPDIPGFGESAKPEPPVTAAGIAATLDAGLAEILGPNGTFAAAGFSMGGLIGGYLAQRVGARLRHLVMVGASGTQAQRNPLQALQSWRRLPTEAERIEAHRKNLGILMIYDPRKIDALALHVQKYNAERSRLRGGHVSRSGALSECLPGFAGKLSGIWGEHDATAAPFLAERRELLRQFSPDATFDIFPNAGHWVQYEAHESFNRRLRELLT